MWAKDYRQRPQNRKLLEKVARVFPENSRNWDWKIIPTLVAHASFGNWPTARLASYIQDNPARPSQYTLGLSNAEKRPRLKRKYTGLSKRAEWS